MVVQQQAGDLPVNMAQVQCKRSAGLTCSLLPMAAQVPQGLKTASVNSVGQFRWRWGLIHLADRQRDMRQLQGLHKGRQNTAHGVWFVVNHLLGEPWLIPILMVHQDLQRWMRT